MLTEICAEIRNYFTEDADRHFGKFEIKDGVFAPPLDFIQEGQYYRVIGSVFNDGVHQFPAAELADETFTGAVWAMRVPPDVVQIAEEIQAYNESDAAKPSAYASESFGGYSYTRATGKNGAPVGWQTVYADRLRKYRKVMA